MQWQTIIVSMYQQRLMLSHITTSYMQQMVLSKIESIFDSTIIENIPKLKIPKYYEIFRVPYNAYEKCL